MEVMKLESMFPDFGSFFAILDRQTDKYQSFNDLAVNFCAQRSLSIFPFIAKFNAEHNSSGHLFVLPNNTFTLNFWSNITEFVPNFENNDC